MKNILSSYTKLRLNSAVVLILVSLTFLPLSSQKVLAGSLNRISVMSIDSPDIDTTFNSTAYLVDANYGYYGSWIKQVSSASNPSVMRVGGERIAVLLEDGTLLTKDSPYAHWVTQTTGVAMIRLGSNGEMMLINSAGNVYSKKGLYDTWVQQTSGGGANFIAISGTGRMMVVDSASNAYSKESTYDAWIKQVDGADRVYLGSNGGMGVINLAGNAYTKMNSLDPWVQQTNGGGTKDLGIGGNGRIMVIDSASNAYSKESTYDVWIKQVDGAEDIDVGSSGRMVVINSNWEVYSKDLPTIDWNLVYRSNYPRNYSWFVSIN